MRGEAGVARSARAAAGLLVERATGPAAVAVRVLGAAGALGVLLAMMRPTLSAEFGLIDDHNIIREMPTTGRLPLTEVPSQVVELTGEGTGRFRPVYWLGQSLEEAIAGHSATLWYVDRYLLAAVVLLSVYLVANRFIGPLPSALIALLPFSGPQFETWTRLGPNEAYALPLATVGLALIAVRVTRGQARPSQLTWGYLLLLLSGLAKENFVLLAPSVALASVAVPALRRTFTRRDWAVVVGVVVLAALDLLAVSIQVARYGTIYPQRRTPEAVADKLTEIFTSADQWGFSTIGLVAAVTLLLLRVHEDGDRSSLLRTGVVVPLSVVLLVLPQAVLLAGTVSQGRYLYPAVLLVVFIWLPAFGLAAMGRPGARRMAITALMALTLVIPLQRGYENAHQLATTNAVTTRAFQAQLEFVAQRARDLGVRVLVMQPQDPERDFEPADSMATYLAKEHGLRSMVVPADEATTAFGVALNRELRRWSRQGSHTFEPYREDVACLSLTWGLQSFRCDEGLQVY
jgi:hypothetical protein